jgi:hypothetical protein
MGMFYSIWLLAAALAGWAGGTIDLPKNCHPVYKRIDSVKGDLGDTAARE